MLELATQYPDCKCALMKPAFDTTLDDLDVLLMRPRRAQPQPRVTAFGSVLGGVASRTRFVGKNVQVEDFHLLLLISTPLHT
jgi:hypothetical protein